MFINFLNLKKEKGFNLFTALVSLLLVSITLVLIFNMIKTEETNLSLIYDQSSSSDLITVADLARADAFDVFVVTLRSQWEYKYSTSDSEIILTRRLIDYNWDNFVNKMVQEKFFNYNFSGFVANSIVSKLRNLPNPTGYTITVNDLNATKFQNIFVDMFHNVSNKTKVVDCNQNSNSCVGSFYLPFTAKVGTDGITAEQYDQLPKVTVLRLKNNEVIQRPVFGKQIYKIYMPWRGFQAFRVVRRIAYSKEREKSENPIIYTGNNNPGFFDAKLHNALEQARLGICDPKTCAPRQYLFETPSENGFLERCNPTADGDSSNTYTVDNIGINKNNNLTVNGTNIALENTSHSYDITLPSVSSNIFRDLITTTFKNNLEHRNADDIIYKNTGLIMDGVNYGAGVNVLKIYVKSNGFLTKEVSLPVIADDKEPTEIDSKVFNPSSSWNNSWGLGLGLDSDYNVIMPPAQSSWLEPKDIQPAPTSENQYLKCSELSLVAIYFKFSETNEKYKIRTKINGDNPYLIIRLEDYYTPFRYNTPTLNNLFSSGLQGNGYFDYSSSDPKLSSFKQNYVLKPIEKSEWTCKSYKGASELKKACVYEQP